MVCNPKFSITGVKKGLTDNAVRLSISMNNPVIPFLSSWKQNAKKDFIVVAFCPNAAVVAFHNTLGNGKTQS
ncbi:hypothetical protein D3C75_1227450 [compost metagenome]